MTARPNIEFPENLIRVSCADAVALPLPDASVDLIITSPPYWKKRDYGFAHQIGQEPTVEGYTNAMAAVLAEMRRVLRPAGSAFINIGDTYRRQSLVGVPSRIELAALEEGWRIRNRIIWAKPSGMPSPVRTRLLNRHEYILHLVRRKKYYYDIQGYSEWSGDDSKPGDVWEIPIKPNGGRHPAPFPPELVERAIVLACPEAICPLCGRARRRIARRTTRLDPSRPQAVRALELAREAGLTEEHLAAIRATGIADAGKAIRWQTRQNSAGVRRLAAEAKDALGGYFREFTFPKWETAGFEQCDCDVPMRPGMVLDPFCGAGTTLKVAASMKRIAIGIDGQPPEPATAELTRDRS